jgi:PleD family two-component response regulator
VSIGVTFGGSGISSDQLLCNADLAMYGAKDTGRDRYVVFDPLVHQSHGPIS